MTLPELTETYREARRAMIERRAATGMTQTEAAKDLGVTLTCLNNLIHRYSIHWPVIRQGNRKGTN